MRKSKSLSFNYKTDRYALRPQREAVRGVVALCPLHLSEHKGLAEGWH